MLLSMDYFLLLERNEFSLSRLRKFLYFLFVSESTRHYDTFLTITFNAQRTYKRKPISFFRLEFSNRILLLVLMGKIAISYYQIRLKTDVIFRMVSSTASLSGSQIRPGSASLVEQPVQIPGYTSQISQNTPVINSIMKPSQPVNFNFKGRFQS